MKDEYNQVAMNQSAESLRLCIVNNLHNLCVCVCVCVCVFSVKLLLSPKFASLNSDLIRASLGTCAQGYCGQVGRHDHAGPNLTTLNKRRDWHLAL